MTLPAPPEGTVQSKGNLAACLFRSAAEVIQVMVDDRDAPMAIVALCRRKNLIAQGEFSIFYTPDFTRSDAIAQARLIRFFVDEQATLNSANQYFGEAGEHLQFISAPLQQANAIYREFTHATRP